MATAHNLPQVQNSRKSPINRSGVLTLAGFGIKVRMQSGHLEIEDGIGLERRTIRLARVGHGLKRLVCISEDGFTTLSALKWLADVGVPFSLLNRNGKVLFVTGPTATSDARLRRAQALALGNGVGLEICCTLIAAKLEGQERVVRERANDPVAAQEIAGFREKLPDVDTAGALRNLEAQAAVSYFAAWRDIPVRWPKADLPRIPDHWRTVGSRQSPLSGGPRLAITPVHAILNYCFALLESESRLALAALGLDPGLGLGLHTDTPNRDSLALDVLEPVRPEVERWVLSWVTREPLRRADFFETPTGNCRLMSHLCAKLSETAPTWGKLVAPWAEFVARTLWARKPQSRATGALPTHLTQQHRREAKGQNEPPKAIAPRPQRVCHGCGAVLSGQQGKHCALCGVAISRANMIEVARRGRSAAKNPESRARMSASQLRQRAARRGWLPSSLPAWLTQTTYREMILPRLAEITVPVLAKTLNVSEPYAAKVRKGQHVPHPMHWQALGSVGRCCLILFESSCSCRSSLDDGDSLT
jgi:CRISPR-associated endonuclease Cas1